METAREKGFYTLTLSAASPSDKRLIGTQGTELSVKVMTEITVEDVEIGVADREQSGSGSNVHKIAPHSKLGAALEADVHQKVALKFSVKDKSTNQLTKVHQAFVIFTHLKSSQEIIFVAEADSTKVYKFDADLQKSVKDFDYLSGKYAVKIVLGDAVVNNAINWVLADITLKFPEHPSPVAERQVSVGDVSYEKKPEIAHLFRTPEKRPPQVVSDAFTGLVLLPLGLLLILWLRIGVNINNFPFSLFAVAFHLGLTAIFGLYLLFWLKLNMFQTLKYLTIIGSVTFFCGNRMLRAIAEKQKAKAE
jgi:oligosaccharyltransferase complex subunit delta (ribophorin II)